MNWAAIGPGLLAVLAALLAVAATAGTIAAFRVSRNTAVVKSYSDAADANDRLVAALRGEGEQNARELSEARAEVQNLRGRVELLTELATGRKDIEALLAAVTAMRAEIGQARSDIMGAVSMAAPPRAPGSQPT